MNNQIASKRRLFYALASIVAAKVTCAYLFVKGTLEDAKYEPDFWVDNTRSILRAISHFAFFCLRLKMNLSFPEPSRFLSENNPQKY